MVFLKRNTVNSAKACARGFGWSPLSEGSNRTGKGHPSTVYSEESQEPGTVGGGIGKWILFYKLLVCPSWAFRSDGLCAT